MTFPKKTVMTNDSIKHTALIGGSRVRTGQSLRVRMMLQNLNTSLAPEIICDYAWYKEWTVQPE